MGLFSGKNIGRGGVALLAALLTMLDLPAATLSEAEAVARCDAWRQDHPIMAKTVARDTLEWCRFPDTAASAYFVYLVTFDPVGYVVLNSDDRLPLVVAFSDNSGVNLEAAPDNAFRALLLTHVERAAVALQTMPDTPLAVTAQPLAAVPLSATYGPYLTTAWDQCNPYNLYAPETPGVSYGYNGRAPAGCVPVAYAQVLAYYQWPAYGSGSHSYVDGDGALTGAHSADFSVPFLWDEMQPEYDWWITAQPGDAATADLIYRLGVACEIDFEADGSSASIVTLASRVRKYFFYELPTYLSTQGALLAPLNADLRAGYPGVVAIPGHAIVADGLIEDGAGDTYHINYGWGGDNNGWYAANSVPGGAISYGCVGIRPALVALPAHTQRTALADDPVTLYWQLPERRADEAAYLLLQRLGARTGTWGEAAENLDHAENSGWQVKTGGRSGKCWFAGPADNTTITLSDRFTPTSGTTFSLYAKCVLHDGEFTINVSTNNGQSFNIEYQKTRVTENSFKKITVNLGTYAGNEIIIRLEHSIVGTYYTEGGVWVDDLSLNSGTWRRWETLERFSRDDASLAATVLPDGLAIGNYTLAAVLEDGAGLVHRRSPAFTLAVNTLFTYTAGPADTATITGYYGTNSLLEIPAQWDGRTVTAMGGAALAAPTVRHVVLPTTVTVVAGDIFGGSASLQGVFFTGDAPLVTPPAFGPGAVPPLYRLPGTSGWGATLGGYPVLVWNPAVVAGPSFGFSQGRFGFTISGTPTIPVRVQSTADLGQPQWRDLGSVIIGAGGTCGVIDQAAPVPASRFYRFVWP